MIRAGLIATALLLTAPVMAADAPVKPRPITLAEKKAIIAQFSTMLLDGQSAIWRWPLVQNGASVAGDYCGFVNAKNRMGAYVGFHAFYIFIFRPPGKPVTAAGGMLISEADPQSLANSIVPDLCAGAGYSVTDIPPE